MCAPSACPLATTFFAEAQHRVHWHYHWMILHEFLPHIVGQAVVDDVLANGRRFYVWPDEPFLPREFSVAAYQFGHSLVRPGYRISGEFARPIFAPESTAVGPDGLPNDLSGGRQLLPGQVIDWKRFFEIDSYEPQVAKAFDTKLSSLLFNSPQPPGTPDYLRSLAVRNLLRNLAHGLPEGQNVAMAMLEQPLRPEELRDLRQLGLEKRRRSGSTSLRRRSCGRTEHILDLLAVGSSAR